MGYIISPNFFAPKYDISKRQENIHAISYDRCNFKCEYCVFYHRRKESKYQNYTEVEFEKYIKELMPLGQSFKLTGGEPTLDPNFMSRLRTIKRLGGYVYLDTNGSQKEIIKEAINESLIDVLGLSLKGLDSTSAMKITHQKSSKWCWENPLDVLKCASKSNITKVIVTYVCYSSFCEASLNCLAELLQAYPNVYMKINNYIEDDRIKGFYPQDDFVIENTIHSFLQNNKSWKNRIIYIPNSSAVKNKSSIKFY